ncbi:Hypothetical predicted protein [Lecanosticta acicola]|uniref:Uncharacterized protein n=1 Tax=Lecanosticta acicola TaxID=111012 RepID=A0AAI8Z4G2_9PEZI|nr:Hypothetical predicted protein [Lecanosticta acicola]
MTRCIPIPGNISLADDLSHSFSEFKTGRNLDSTNHRYSTTNNFEESTGDGGEVEQSVASIRDTEPPIGEDDGYEMPRSSVDGEDFPTILSEHKPMRILILALPLLLQIWVLTQAFQLGLGFWTGLVISMIVMPPIELTDSDSLLAAKTHGELATIGTFDFVSSFIDPQKESTQPLDGGVVCGDGCPTFHSCFRTEFNSRATIWKITSGLLT